MLSKFREFFFRQKYRFDLGLQFLVFVNFALLIITASDKIKSVFNLKTTDLVVLLLPLAFIGTWLFGYILDNFVKSPQAQERQAVGRSEAWNKLYRKLDEIERKIDKAQPRKEMPHAKHAAKHFLSKYLK